MDELQSASVKVKCGFVAYFDVLGYKTLLDRNSLEYVATRVIKVLRGLETDQMAEEQAKLVIEVMGLPERSREPVKEAIRSVKSLSISDSILTTIETGSITTPSDYSDRFSYWFIFAQRCAMLWERMFTEGLPVRGAIAQGDYFIEGACWAGKPLIEAYGLAESLNFAGCVIAQDVIRWIMPGFEIMGIENVFMYSDYSVPLNDGRFEQATVLNVNWHLTENQLPTTDIRQSVHERFWDHRKEATGSVLTKLDNTERYLRFLRSIRNGKTAPIRRMG